MDTKALKKKKQLEDLEAQVQAIVLKQKEEAQDMKRKSWVSGQKESVDLLFLHASPNLYINTIRNVND